MVLSNKKLKQKLRAAVSDSITESVAIKKTAVTSNLQSLKELIVSATHRPRLSKREKRRKKLPESSEEKKGESVGVVKAGRDKEAIGEDELKNTKKRKRNDEVSSGGVPESKEDVEADKKSKKRKQKKEKKKSEGKGNEVKKKLPESSQEKKEGFVGVVKAGRDKEAIGEDELKNTEKRKRNDQVSSGGVPESKENVEADKKSKKRKKKKKKKTSKGKGNEVKSEFKEEKASDNGGEQSRLAEAANVAKSHENSDTATKVYVGGIPYYSTEDDIRSHFGSCGTITELFCMTFPDTGKFRGIAIISFKTEAAAKRALAFDESDMGGFLLKVKPYKSPSATKTTADKSSKFAPQMLDGYNKAYIGNLSWDVTEDDLRNLFSDCKISSIRFGTDKETGEFKGYAHVDFSDNLSLTMALKLDQQLVCGRPAKISCAVPPKTTPKLEKEIEPEAIIIQEDTSAVDPGMTKKKIRRKCYLCGEKGHLSSSCPTAQNQDQKNA